MIVCLQGNTEPFHGLSLASWHDESRPALDELIFSEICELINFQLKAAIWNSVVFNNSFVVLGEDSEAVVELFLVQVGSAVLGDELEEG